MTNTYLVCLSGLSLLGAIGPACGDEAASDVAVDTRGSDTTDAEVEAPDTREDTVGDVVDPSDAVDGDDAADVPHEPDPGALIRVSASSTVAYLLEDVPPDLRDGLAAALIAKPESFWKARAELQLSATRYRLGYRRLFTFLEKGILPLPPDSKRALTLANTGPRRTTIDGHDVVAVDYTMTGLLLSDLDSVAVSEPALVPIGGTWVEPFVVPADPDLVMQRTGLACIRELAETSELLDAENALRFYDFTCKGNELRPIGCHTSPYPDDCQTALEAKVGHIAMAIAFERLPWSAALAEKARIPFVTTGAPDLKVLPAGLAYHQILYSYIAPDSCAVFEGCVKGSGWRRLLRFDASLENVGSQDLTIGPLKDSPYLAHNTFEFSQCHEHYHFRFYGDFSIEGADGPLGAGDKRAFCLLSTSRYANNEDVPLTHEHDYCNNQGIVRGWGDDYYAGLDCQWIDVTDVRVVGESQTLDLHFDANPAGFLCEGAPVTDEAGAQVFAATDYVTEDGLPIERPECTLIEGYDQNNHGQSPVVVPKVGGMVSLPCTRAQSGMRRDCGFSIQAGEATCSAGQPVTVECSVADPAAGQIVRVCETSKVLGQTIACTFRDAVASAVIRGGAETLTFTCPGARGDDEPGGAYGILGAPILDGGAAQPVTCTIK